MNEEEATKSWLSAVDIEAAIMAERRRPEIAGGKISLASSMNTILCLPLARSSSPMSILPNTAMKITAQRAITTQEIATIADFLTIEGFLIAIKRTRMWGIPK